MCSYIMFDKSETVKKLITNSEKCRISQLKNSYSKNVCLNFHDHACQELLLCCNCFLRNLERVRSCRRNFYFAISQIQKKHLFWSLFVIKLLDWRPATLLKRGSSTGVLLSILWNVQEDLYFQRFLVAALKFIFFIACVHFCWLHDAAC